MIHVSVRCFVGYFDDLTVHAFNLTTIWSDWIYINFDVVDEHSQRLDGNEKRKRVGREEEPEHLG